MSNYGQAFTSYGVGPSLVDENEQTHAVKTGAARTDAIKVREAQASAGKPSANWTHS